MIKTKDILACDMDDNEVRVGDKVWYCNSAVPYKVVDLYESKNEVRIGIEDHDSKGIIWAEEDDIQLIIEEKPNIQKRLKKVTEDSILEIYHKLDELTCTLNYEMKDLPVILPPHINLLQTCKNICENLHHDLRSRAKHAGRFVQ